MWLSLPGFHRLHDTREQCTCIVSLIVCRYINRAAENRSANPYMRFYGSEDQRPLTFLTKVIIKLSGTFKFEFVTLHHRRNAVHGKYLYYPFQIVPVHPAVLEFLRYGLLDSFHVIPVQRPRQGK